MLHLLPLALLLTQDAPPRERAAERARDIANEAVRHAAAADSINRTPPTAAQLADAYADADAARLVAEARARWTRAERLVVQYDATVTQRVGVGIRALRRDRILARQELAARVTWHRDGPSSVELVGLRQRFPGRENPASRPSDGALTNMAFNPAADYLRILGTNSAETFSHPLRLHAEADYRYASGDTTTIELPDGRTVRIVELRVVPRRAEVRLISGSFWFDADSWGLVRAVFRPARPLHLRTDRFVLPGRADRARRALPRDPDDLPDWVDPVVQVRHLTIEYGYYEQQWWLPRYLAVEAEGEMTGIRAPVRFERVYSAYRVIGGGEPDSLARPPAGTIENDEIPVGGRRTSRRSHWPVRVTFPSDDPATLAAHPGLGEPILDMGSVISESELRELAGTIGNLPQAPWTATAQLPTDWTYLLRHARYNRVEGLSLGLAGRFDFGRLILDAGARLGTGDRTPGAVLQLTRPGHAVTWRVAAYRRLDAVNPDTRPFTLPASLGAFFAGRDDGEYLRATGVEISATPGATHGDAWQLRLFTERQRGVRTTTGLSLPDLLGRDGGFRPVIAAAPAHQTGANLRRRWHAAFAPEAGLTATATLDAATGSFAYARGSLTSGLRLPLAGLVVGLEASAGTTRGAAPIQAHWFLGGPATLRGYTGGAVHGDAYWRARAEAGPARATVRWVAFADAGWAGDRDAFGAGKPRLGVGAGASVLDGLLRLDVAKGLRAPGGWRADLYVDGLF